MTAVRRPALVIAAALALAGCAGGPAPGGVACGRLDDALRLPGLRIGHTETVAADALGHPAHCLVRGTLDERAGSDGRRYATAFEMRLPQAWNQRFLHQTNGGTDGIVRPAHGDLGIWATDALARGFAVISSNAGHDAEDPANLPTGLVRGQVFGLDPQARRDLGHAATEALWPVAQGLMRAHYGSAPRHNYLAGCGNGGRHAMVAASRQPERYDGILAGAPGLHQPRAALQHAWDIQAWRTVDDDIRRAFSPADLRLVAERVVARCDALDLVVDGLVGDLRRCQSAFRLAELQCTGAKTPACLSAAQVQALQRSFAGPHNGRGEPLYSDWPFDGGIGAAGWRTWKLESAIAPWDRLPIIATMGAGALAYVYSTPPAQPVGTPAALLDYLARYDFDRDAPALFATSAEHPESAVALMTPPDADEPRLAGFARRGGKLIVYHGGSDPVFSVNDTLRWADRLQHNLGLLPAAAVARVFAVPHMGHCHGGPATDQFDALGALVDWVEQGRAPARLEARVKPANPELPAGWSPQRSRPLCPHPQVPRYAGGDVESAASFRCATP